MKILFVNGKIYTGKRFVSSLAIEDGKIVKDDGHFDECIDLNGRFVCAGFNDSHMHLLNYGKFLLSAKLNEHTSSLKELIEYGKTFLKENPLKEGQWLQGRGFNQDYFEDEKRMPERSDLDQISEDIPIVFTRTCGHSLCVNSKVLEIVGITKDTKDVPGGKIGKDENGQPNGLFYDNAMDLVTGKLPLPNKEDLKEMIQKACTSLNSFGITSVQSDDYCLYREIPFETVNEAYRELTEEGKLSVRVYEQCNFTKTEDLQDFLDKGYTTKTGDDFFRTGPLKLLGDGSLGSRTAYLSRPYDDDPETRGFPLFTAEEMEELVMTAHRNGMQIATHAIGDACLDQVLTAYEKALEAYPREDHRHGIVHCQISRPDQLKKIEDLRLHVYAQSVFLDYDNHIVERRAGKELASSSYRWKTLWKNGVTVSNGSDAPVEIPDVLKGIECAVTRTSLDGTGPYLPEEAFTIEEALSSFTDKGAYASFEEEKKGSLEEGYLADFVILDQDPFLTDPKKIHEIRVLETWLNGNRVYQSKDA